MRNLVCQHIPTIPHYLSARALELPADPIYLTRGLVFFVLTVPHTKVAYPAFHPKYQQIQNPCLHYCQNSDLLASSGAEGAKSHHPGLTSEVPYDALALDYVMVVEKRCLGSAQS
jgi:hypothetical protein